MTRCGLSLTGSTLSKINDRKSFELHIHRKLTPSSEQNQRYTKFFARLLPYIRL